MDLQVKYGTFLRKQELSNARYEYEKPAFRRYAICGLAFAVGMAVMFGVANMYATMLKPVQPYDAGYFQKAQALSAEVSKGLAKLKEARPNDINVCSIIQEFTNKPKEVDLVTISITPDKYVVKGTTNNVNAPNEYLNMLNFPRKHKAISDIRTSDLVTEFTITVTPEVKKGGKK